MFLNPTEAFKKGDETEGLFSRFFHILNCIIKSEKTKNKIAYAI